MAMTEISKIEIAPGLAFDVMTAGEPDAPLVLLLHGFAESFHMWQPLAQALAAAGYRAVAPSQRGYSPGRGPTPRSSSTTRSTIWSPTPWRSPSAAATRGAFI
jgi:pimeloyl-ACP methyl ester carboxylesterase